MKLLIILLASCALAAAVKYEVNPNIDTSKLTNRLTSILSNKLHKKVQQVAPKNAVNDMIIAWLEELRDQFEDGFPDSGIPPLDPFTLDLLEFAVSESFLLKLDITLRDILMTGLKEFIISNINFRILALTLDYEFIVPQVDLSSNFEVDGKVATIIDVNPSGEAQVGITNLTTWGSIRMSVNGTGYLRLVNFNFDYDADRFLIYLEGLFETDKINEVLNFILEHLSNDFFQGQRERLTAFITEVLSEIIAEILSEIKLTDLLPMVYPNLDIYEDADDF